MTKPKLNLKSKCTCGHTYGEHMIGLYTDKTHSKKAEYCTATVGKLDGNWIHCSCRDFEEENDK
jgi:hypothetical protein